MSTSPLREGSRLRAVVIDDEWPAREYLVELLLGSSSVDVVGAVATLEEARLALGPDGIDVEVAFVDINLATSGGSEAGLALVREFAGARGAPLFVLATALKHHAVEAFSLDVVDYLLKPFSEARVLECLVRVAKRRPRPAAALPSRIVARSKKGLVFLARTDAWAFEASERLTFVHCAAGRFDVDLSLAAIESTLGEDWLRVHRNWVVNMTYVTAMERDELGSALVLRDSIGVPSGSVRAPVSRSKAQEVRELLLEGATGIRR